MATVAQFEAALNRVDIATTQIGQGIQTLLDRIQAGGLTDAEEAAALDAIGVRALALENMASDVNNPVPVLPPPVV